MANKDFVASDTWFNLEYLISITFTKAWQFYWAQASFAHTSNLRKKEWNIPVLELKKKQRFDLFLHSFEN